MQWFRFYNDALNDPKVQYLDGEHFKAWINMLCMSSRNDGKVIKEQIPFFLRCAEQDAEKIISDLMGAGFFHDGGDHLVPHNWKKWQWISDNGKERVKRYRERRKAKGLSAQTSVTKKKRQTVYSRDGFKCVYCKSAEDLTLDHKIPESRGGDNEINNLHTACRVCNATKGSMTHDEFLLRNVTTPLPLRPQTTETETETEKKGGAKEFSPPEWVPPEPWADFMEHRKKKGKLTERAKELLVKELEKLKSQGHDPEKVLNQSIMRGWTGLFAIKGEYNGESRGGAGKNKHERLKDALASSARDGGYGFES